MRERRHFFLSVPHICTLCTKSMGLHLGPVELCLRPSIFLFSRVRENAPAASFLLLCVGAGMQVLMGCTERGVHKFPGSCLLIRQSATFLIRFFLARADRFCMLCYRIRGEFLPSWGEIFPSIVRRSPYVTLRTCGTSSKLLDARAKLCAFRNKSSYM